MNNLELNTWIKECMELKSRAKKHPENKLTLEALDHAMAKVNHKYGIYLSDILFEVYDEFFEDNEIKQLSDYLSEEGVEVDADDFPGVRYKLRLKPFPLRFEIEGKSKPVKEIVWQLHTAA